MNKTILLGNLTREPEMRYSQGEKSIAITRFTVAVNRRFTREGEPDTDYFSCTAFGKQAETIEKYFHKGSRILVSGRLQNDNYTNKNGEKVYSVQLIVEEVDFPERKSVADNNRASEPVPTDDNFMDVPDDYEGLPFN